MSKFEQPQGHRPKGSRLHTGKEAWNDSRKISLEEQLGEKGWIIVSNISPQEKLSKNIQTLNVGESVGTIVFDPIRVEISAFDAAQWSNFIEAELSRDGWEQVGRNRYTVTLVRSKQNSI